MPRRTILWITATLFLAIPVFGQSEPSTLDQARKKGLDSSQYRTQIGDSKPEQAPAANLDEFNRTVLPLLRDACFECHGESNQEGEFRVDTLDPNLLSGKDTAWWVEVFDVLSKGEMPPEGEELLSGSGRSQIIEWLSSELQVASQVARTEQGHSSFRRLTRYEYNYALQDLLGLPYDFAKDLPPETVSEDGFLNSSEMLQLSSMQFETYREAARAALRKATVRGEQPQPIFYGITMEEGLEKEIQKFESDLENLRKRFADDPEKLEAEIAKRKNSGTRGVHYKNLETGFATQARWSYNGARYARTPVDERPDAPGSQPVVAVIPYQQRLIVDLGDHLPASGSMRLRIRAGKTSTHKNAPASLRVIFGHQASNNSRADERVGTVDIPITAETEAPEFYTFDVPLGEVVRNPFRGIQKLGMTPNPAEYVMLHNTSDPMATIQIDYIEIITPHFESWPTKSHRNVFPQRQTGIDDQTYSREVITNFMRRAWRRTPAEAEINQKLALSQKLRPHCKDLEETLVNVLAEVLSSPKFLYIITSKSKQHDLELATRLSMFLWSSLPDRPLIEAAEAGKLSDENELRRQVDRMLDDPRANRFAKHFVRQWLGMQLMDHLQIHRDLRDSMHQEPIAYFREVLKSDASIIDFLHSDYAVVDGKLARHYGIQGVVGNEFRRVSLEKEKRRGGLLTQAGLLAMNSDGKDSHPLKRGIWLLEKVLNDPPPPPPPAVPEIDLSDPDILKLTLKKRMEDHRNDPACMSCHQRIDPWGIAFENFDAQGRFRTKIGGKPVDAHALLFNKQPLDGIDGLKRYLLENRQDQFARAMTFKLMTYALGRPMAFADRAELDKITAKCRAEGDGLRSLVHLIVASDLFRQDDVSSMIE